MTGNDLPGALAGIRVVELAGEASAYAGLLLAGMGAEVIVVEPPDGHHTRGFEPFLDDDPDPERSLWWWHYNASKLGVTLDLGDEDDRNRFRSLVATRRCGAGIRAPWSTGRLGHRPRHLAGPTIPN